MSEMHMRKLQQHVKGVSFREFKKRIFDRSIVETASEIDK